MRRTTWTQRLYNMHKRLQSLIIPAFSEAAHQPIQQKRFFYVLWQGSVLMCSADQLLVKMEEWCGLQLAACQVFGLKPDPNSQLLYPATILWHIRTFENLLGATRHKQNVCRIHLKTKFTKWMQPSLKGVKTNAVTGFCTLCQRTLSVLRQPTSLHIMSLPSRLQGHTSVGILATSDCTCPCACPYEI